MEATVATMKALADRNRLRILMGLYQHDELCACQITELLQVRGATASRHLGVLQRAGLVSRRKDGKWIHYRLRKDAENDPLVNLLGKQLTGSPDITADRLALKAILACDPEEICRKQRGEECCPLPRK